MRPESCSEQQWALVERMCAHDPTARIKISTVEDELARLAIGSITRVTANEVPSIESISDHCRDEAVSNGPNHDLSQLPSGASHHDLLWDRLDHLSAWIKDGSHGDLVILRYTCRVRRCLTHSIIELLLLEDTQGPPVAKQPTLARRHCRLEPP